jgi:multiple sugar transport system permease protein
MGPAALTGRRRWSRGAWLRAVLLAVAFVWTLFPVYWMVVTSFKTTMDIFSLRLQLLPAHPTLDNFIELWTGVVPVPTYFANSVVTSTATCVLTIAVCLLAAYAFSRLEFRNREPLQLSLLIAQMFPFVVLLIPLYLIFLKSHLLNTNAGLVLAFASTAIPVGVWFMKGFMDSVPRELDEAARIDGCSDLRLLRDVLLPLMIPGIIAVGVFAFLDAWNNLYFPLAFVSNPHGRTLPVGLLFAVDSRYREDWGGLMAASILASLPPIAGFVAVQRWLISGMGTGALRG